MHLIQTELSPIDFRAVFEQSVYPELLLDTSLTIVAATDAYLKATLTARPAIIGRYLFEVFPDNPDWGHADGVSQVRQALFKVIKTRAPSMIPPLRYDIRKPGGGFEERHWRSWNWPILGADGLVEWILHQTEDVTSQAQKEHNATRG